MNAIRINSSGIFDCVVHECRRILIWAEVYTYGFTRPQSVEQRTLCNQCHKFNDNKYACKPIQTNIYKHDKGYERWALFYIWKISPFYGHFKINGISPFHHIKLLMIEQVNSCYYTPAQQSWRGVYWIHLVRPSVCPSIRPSVCRRHGFRSISQVSFGISISNFICMVMVAIGRSLLIFSGVTFKMAAWRPHWIFWFLDSNFTLALNINCKLQWHNTYVYG